MLIYGYRDIEAILLQYQTPCRYMNVSIIRNDIIEKNGSIEFRVERKTSLAPTPDTARRRNRYF